MVDASTGRETVDASAGVDRDAVMEAMKSGKSVMMIQIIDKAVLLRAFENSRLWQLVSGLARKGLSEG